jgi:glycosyltransferase involved in cell wall biosynthesis
MLRCAVNNDCLVDWSFYCIGGTASALDQEAHELGAKVVYSPAPLGSKEAFVRALRSELRRGAYHVLHAHHDLVSAVYLLAALGLPIKKRIVHVHNADESMLTPSILKQTVFRPIFRYLCLTWADQVVGNSNHSLDTFLAGRERRQGRDVIHYLGVDPEPFVKARADRLAFRHELDLSDDARIILFAGRMVPEKNPVFAVDVVAEMHRMDARVVGVFVGSGSLEIAVRARAERLGLGAAFRHLGWRADVAEVMSCCDWFILPHPENPPEGFGFAIVEAQLAGLRLVLSHGILDDPLLPGACVRRLSLSDEPRLWSKAAMDMMEDPPPSRANAIADLKRSPMDMQRALNDLLALHGQTPHFPKLSADGRRNSRPRLER